MKGFFLYLWVGGAVLYTANTLLVSYVLEPDGLEKATSAPAIGTKASNSTGRPSSWGPRLAEQNSQPSLAAPSNPPALIYKQARTDPKSHVLAAQTNRIGDRTASSPVPVTASTTFDQPSFTESRPGKPKPRKKRTQATKSPQQVERGFRQVAQREGLRKRPGDRRRGLFMFAPRGF